MYLRDIERLRNGLRVHKKDATNMAPQNPSIQKMVKVLELCGWANFRWLNPPIPENWEGRGWHSTMFCLWVDGYMLWVGAFRLRRVRTNPEPEYMNFQKDYYPTLLKAVAERHPEHLEEAKKILS